MSVRADQRSESSLLFYKIARELRREISCDLLNKFNSKNETFTIDYSKYFDNVNHEVLLQLVKEQIKDRRLFALTKFYIHEFGPVGLGLGSQVSQILAAFFPNKIDHFIKEKLRIRFYGRYMDDSYLLSDSKEELERALEEIKVICEKHGIRLNPKKTRITPIKDGVEFLHCRYRFGKNGRIIRSGGRESVQRERRKLKKFRQKLDEGKMTPKQIYNNYISWRGFMKYFDSKTLLRNTDKLYNHLFVEG